ncbi:MAG TPA: DUF1800 domain-containing protein [Pyrinomonadaceae bacterium]|nr:DUF1800 domain-containing protein [Pyrinomonadaceae bacterium]
MRTFNNLPSQSPKSVRAAVAVVALAAILSGSVSRSSSFAGTDKSSKKKLTEEQRIVHVLNRLGFGARPGDIERVKSIGVENYVNQQLAPDKISDAVAEDKVKVLTSLTMSTAELYEKYPQPGQLLRQLQQRGMLPENLAEARDNRTKGGANSTSAPNPNQMPGQAPQPQAPPQNPLDNEKYRQVVRDYYMQNGLLQPQRLSADLQASRILRAVYSERQLNEVMVDFWTNHFNVFMGKGADRWLLPAYDRDTIRPNAMGKFANLLEATAKSPAMLFYLDNFQSVSPNAQPPGGQRPRQRQILRGLEGEQRRRNALMNQGVVQPVPRPPTPQQQRRGINENYARELMELHTMGVDGGYTQKDVQEVARCFTGWTIFAPRGGAAAVSALMGDAARRTAGTFFFNARAHDDGEKVVLGHKIPSGGGIKDGLMVLEILAHHPSTAKFIATKLVHHFVSDNPPASLVNRVAETYAKTDGDIREMLKTIFFSNEFNSPEAYRAKVKRPFELVISAIRTLGADTNGGPGTHQWLQRMGEPLYGYQTPNGYSDAAESWVNTGGLLERMNFALALVSNRVPGTRVNLAKLSSNLATTGETDKAKLMDQFLNTILGGDISKATRETLLKQLDQTAVVSIPAPGARAEAAPDTGQMEGPDQMARQRPRMEATINDPLTKVIGLILGTPEFQRQ